MPTKFVCAPKIFEQKCAIEQSNIVGWRGVVHLEGPDPWYNKGCPSSPQFNIVRRFSSQPAPCYLNSGEINLKRSISQSEAGFEPGI